MRNSALTLVAGAGLALVLSGCVAPDGGPNYTGGGALIGGVSGAAIGAAASRGDPGAALVGGAVGALTGALIGQSMDAHARSQNPPVAYAAVPVASASAPAVAPPPGPSIDDIKAMTRSGVQEEIIISQIQAHRAVYQLDANAILELKDAGVSEKVITCMINSATTGATASADPVASPGPPPLRQEVIVAAPGPAYAWVGGEWVWQGGGWVWVAGRWALPPRPHAVWVAPRWDQGPYGWHRVPGYWR